MSKRENLVIAGIALGVLSLVALFIVLSLTEAHAGEPGAGPYRRGTPVAPLPWAVDVGVGAGPDIWAPEVGVSHGRFRAALSYVMLSETTESASHTVTSSRLVGLREGKCYHHRCEAIPVVENSSETFTLETKTDDSYPMLSVGVIVWQSK